MEREETERDVDIDDEYDNTDGAYGTPIAGGVGSWFIATLIVLFLLLLVVGLYMYVLVQRQVNEFSSMSGGAVGVSGGDGARGASGMSGGRGVNGVSGFDGPSGFPGLGGPSGASGISGASGGQSGFPGVMGPAGPSGAEGPSGMSGDFGLGSFSGFLSIASTWNPGPFRLAWGQNAILIPGYPPQVYDGSDPLALTYGTAPRTNANDFGWLLTDLKLRRLLWAGSYLSFDQNSLFIDAQGGYLVFPPGIITVQSVTNAFDTIHFADDPVVWGAWWIQLVMDDVFLSQETVLLDGKEVVGGGTPMYNPAPPLSEPPTAPVTPASFVNYNGWKTDWEVNSVTDAPAFLNYVDDAEKMKTYFRSKTYVPDRGYTMSHHVTFQWIMFLKQGVEHTLQVFHQSVTGLETLTVPGLPTTSADIPQMPELPNVQLTLVKFAALF